MNEQQRSESARLADSVNLYRDHPVASDLRIIGTVVTRPIAFDVVGDDNVVQHGVYPEHVYNVVQLLHGDKYVFYVTDQQYVEGIPLIIPGDKIKEYITNVKP